MRGCHWKASLYTHSGLLATSIGGECSAACSKLAALYASTVSAPYEYLSITPTRSVAIILIAVKHMFA